MLSSSLYVALNSCKNQKNSVYEFVIKPIKLVTDHFLTQNLSARFFRIIQSILSFQSTVSAYKKFLKVACIDLLRKKFRLLHF